MTSASIMEMQKTGFAMQASTAKTAPVNVGTQFSDAMEFASAGQQDESATSVQNSAVKTHVEKSAAENTGRKEIRESEPTHAKEDVAQEKVAEEVEAKEEEIVKEIAQQLGVSEEEVREALEVLGFGLTDLLSQGNMAALTAQLTGMQAVDVLTDENLFMQVTELTQSVQSHLQAAADDLGMTLGQLQAAIDEQFASTGEIPEMTEETDVLLQNSAAEEIAEAVETVVGNEGAEAETDSLKTAEVTETEDVASDKEAQDTKLVTDAAKTEAGAQEHFGPEDENGAALMQGNQNTQAVGNDINLAKQVTADELFEGQLDLEQTRELIHQISDYVRVHHSERISSMEIQLHPVELGTVNLQVVAKDGNISARLTVQDEAVRAALEGQVMQLRESLQEQGLKIDAVEVTVATHEFEQNLDQHGKDAEEQAAKEKKSGRRILDLNEIGQGEEEETEMSDADRLQIEMMRMGGNRLNFRV